MSDPKEVVVLVARLLWWLLATVYYAVEALLVALVPRSYRRKDIKGSVALVTGGGSGIGRLMCVKLAARGAVVVTWDVCEAGNEETVRQVRAAGGQCRAYTVDLCDRHAVYAAAAKVKQEVGKVDILVNNAGVVTGKMLLQCPDESIIRTFEVNALSHFWTTKAFLGDMMIQNKGYIVTIASMAGKMTSNNVVDYCASKHAAVGFGESLRMELMVSDKMGVKTILICPMLISTGMFEGAQSLFPILKPEWVAGEVVDAVMMGVSATVTLPWVMWIVVVLNSLLPDKSNFMMAKITGMTKMMDNFVGRRKDQ